MKPLGQGQWEAVFEYRRRGVVDTTVIESALGLPKGKIRDMIKLGRKTRDSNASCIEDEEHQCMKFLERWEASGLELEVHLIQNIVAASADGKWQGAAWLLERLSPERFGAARHKAADTDEELDLTLNRSRDDRKRLAAQAHDAMDAEWETPDD